MSSANYSTNPTNPANQGGGQFDWQTPDPSKSGQVGPPGPQPVPPQPKSIRDYLNIARSQGQVPSFTNRPGGEGYRIQEPEVPQGIPEGPQDAYERLPFRQRVKMDPYVRAQMRIKSLMPQLWEAAFPGMDPGALLDEDQMKRWTGIVEKATGNLLKRFDKQYEWAMQNDLKKGEQRNKDVRFWQSQYTQMVAKGQMPFDEQGRPVPEREWVEQRMSLADEMKYEEDMKKELANEQQLTPDVIKSVIRKAPYLQEMIKRTAIQLASQQLGMQLTDGEFTAMRSDPQLSDQFQKAIQDAIEQHKDQILEAAGK